MCTGLEIPLLMTAIGGIASAAGGAMTRNDQQANATRDAAARNQVLTDTLGRNQTLANDARTHFDDRLASSQPTAMAANQGQATDSRLAALTGNMPAINPTTMPGAADAPTIVKTAISKALSDAMDKSNAKAGAQAQLGGYGDLFFNQGLADKAASDQIGTDVNFARSNIAMVPALQEMAANGVYQPISPIGGILQGLGSVAGSAAGSGKFGQVS